MIEGRAASLFLVLFLSGILFLASGSFKKSKVLKIRRIPGIDAIDEMMGRVTEMGRPIAYVLGGTDLEAQGFASMRILDYVAGQAAKYDVRLFVVAPLPEMEPMCQEILRAAYLREGKEPSRSSSEVMYMPGDGSKAGVLGLYQREKVAGAMLFGNYYYESMLFAEAANLAGASQIGGTANYHQLPFFVASCDYTLIGEEIFAAGTYLSKDPWEIGGLTAQEAGKALSVLLIVLGCIFKTFGDDTISFFLRK